MLQVTVENTVVIPRELLTGYKFRAEKCFEAESKVAMASLSLSRDSSGDPTRALSQLQSSILSLAMPCISPFQKSSSLCAIQCQGVCFISQGCFSGKKNISVALKLLFQSIKRTEYQKPSSDNWTCTQRKAPSTIGMFLAVERSAVRYGMFSSISGLYSLHASNQLCSLKCNNQKCLQMLLNVLWRAKSPHY